MGGDTWGAGREMGGSAPLTAFAQPPHADLQLPREPPPICGAMWGDVGLWGCGGGDGHRTALLPYSRPPPLPHKHFHATVSSMGRPKAPLPHSTSHPIASLTHISLPHSTSHPIASPTPQPPCPIAQWGGGVRPYRDPQILPPAPMGTPRWCPPLPPPPPHSALQQQLTDVLHAVHVGEFLLQELFEASAQPHGDHFDAAAGGGGKGGRNGAEKVQKWEKKGAKEGALGAH